MNALITSGTKSVRLVVVYMPPSKKDQNTTAFLAEFGALLETLALDSANLIIVGDFNIHMDDATSRTGTANMCDLLAENNLSIWSYPQWLSHPGPYPDAGDGEHCIECAVQRSWDFRPQGHRLLAARGNLCQCEITS